MGENKQRLYYLDNIKACAIYSLFIWHTCEVFHCKEGFFIDGKDSLIPTLLYCFASPWLMSVMFFISGIAIMLSLEKRSIKQFYGDRFSRVIKPTIAGILLWIPIQAYFVLKNHTDFNGGFLASIKHFFTHVNSDFYGYDGSFTPSQIWFMCYLIVYMFVAFPLIMFVKKREEKFREAKVVRVWSVALVIVLSFALSYGSTEETFFAFALIFGLGVVLYNNKHFFEITKKHWKLLLVIGIVSNMFASTALIHIRDISYIWTVDYAVCRGIWAVGRVMGTIATIGVGQQFLNKTNDKWKYLTRNSYNYYFIHMQILIMVGYFVIANVKSGVAAQAGLIFFFSIILTILVVEIMKRIPLFRWLYGLKK